MGESLDGSSSTKSYWENWKSYWRTRFALFGDYKRLFLIPEKPLPEWSSADVEEFIASDPIHGPVIKTAREAARYAAYGSAIGAVSTAGLAWRYSKSPHGAVLAFGAGALFGWTFAQEIASHSMQLYKVDTMAAQLKFLDWWKHKSAT